MEIKIKEEYLKYSPSFRVVCRVSKNTIKGKKVKKFGVVYAIKGETVGKDREQLEKLMTKEGASGNSNVKVHEETPNGVYADWSTKDGQSSLQNIGVTMV